MKASREYAHQRGHHKPYRTVAPIRHVLAACRVCSKQTTLWPAVCHHFGTTVLNTNHPTAVITPSQGSTWLSTSARTHAHQRHTPRAAPGLPQVVAAHSNSTDTLTHTRGSSWPSPGGGSTQQQHRQPLTHPRQLLAFPRWWQHTATAPTLMHVYPQNQCQQTVNHVHDCATTAAALAAGPRQGYETLILVS
jgi:hypothetical protein